MDFFEKQARAKRKSLVLISYFLLAVIATALVINILCYFAFRYFSQHQYINITPEYWLSGPFWWVALATTGIILIGSARRYLQLRDGGSRVAIMLGAKPLDMNSHEELHRRLINVTEEISIASGMPMPTIFLLHQEQGINAFVAGHQLQDMALTVSRGAIEQLNRDELQGVIAHEFSHIQNADTRLNMRIMAVLAGILLIGSIGGYLCRSASFSRMGMGYRSRSKNSAGLFAAGAALFVAGYTGLFFGRLIQAAVSRQREWLADATAVQFTRNPQGITGALGKIADSTHGSYLLGTANAQEVNHMCFSESLKLSKWMASHPPLDKRIRAIDPMFLTKQRAARNVKIVKSQTSSLSHHSATLVTSGFAASREATAPPSMHESITMRKPTKKPAPTMHAPAKSLIGTIPEQNYALSHQLLRHFSELFGPELHEAVFAETLLYALLLRESPVAVRRTIDARLSHGEGLIEKESLPEIEKRLQNLQAGTQLSLLEVLAGVLKAQTQAIKDHIIDQIRIIIEADQRTTFTEFIIQTFVMCHLSSKKQRRTINRSEQVIPSLELVMSMFARLGTDSSDIEVAHQLFTKVSKLHYPLTPLTFRPKISGRLLYQAVTKLARLNHHQKPVLIDACLACISADGKVTEKENQLLRIVVEMLDCPMPPMFASVA